MNDSRKDTKHLLRLPNDRKLPYVPARFAREIVCGQIVCGQIVCGQIVCG
jgi:hypothetical protein